MDRFYDSPAWRATRAAVVRRDGNRCTVSRLLGGACAGTIHVHHIEARIDRPDLALDPDNLACVCASHHPRWEALRRALVAQRRLPPCPHKHPYPSGREECERRRMREAGLLVSA